MTTFPPDAVDDAFEDMTSKKLPKRVLHVMNDAGGGAALSTIELIEAVRPRGIDSVAVCHDSGSPAERRRLSEAVAGRVLFTPLYWWNRKTRVAFWKRPLLELRQLIATGWRVGAERRVAEFAERHAVDLIHTNSILIPEGGVAAARLKLPHVWHVRELIGPGAHFRLPIEGPALGRFLAPRASFVVANSQATAERITAWLPPDLLRIVPNGIKVADYSHIRRVPDQRRLIVAMVGNLSSAKKQAAFIEAAARIDRSLPIEFRLYGGLPSRRKLDRLRRSIAAVGLESRLRLPGFVDSVTIMSEIDVLVHTLDVESFGRVFVEAMAAGLPVVAVRGGGAATIVVHGETGFLATPDRPDEIAAYIERLARDSALRAALGEAGRRRAAAQFDISTCSSRMMDVYAAALQKPLGLASQSCVVSQASGRRDRVARS